VITRREILVTLGLAALLLPAPAQAQDNEWHVDTSLNLFLAGMSGDVTTHGIPTQVDVSFSEILEHLEAGFAGRATAKNDRWVLSAEFSYMRLGADPSGVSVEMRQWLVEPSLGYRISDGLQVFAGTRYNNLNGDLTFDGPRGLLVTGTQDWWDPIVGLQLTQPLTKRLSFDGRFDVGGFDAGSEVTWQAFPSINWRVARWGSADIGYRWLATDYQSGSGVSLFRYDVVVSGPQIGLKLHF
jgi:hypothetical protein